MWSDVASLYPSTIAPETAPVGQVLVTEPQVVRSYDYRPIHPQKPPYELTEDYYSRRLWVC